MTNNIVIIFEDKRDSIQKQIESRVGDLLRDIAFAQSQTINPPALVIAQSLRNYHDIAELFGEYNAYATAVYKAMAVAGQDAIDAERGKE